MRTALADLAQALAASAIAAADPARLTREAIERAGLEHATFLLAFGKAARPMTLGALASIPVDPRGYVISPSDASLAPFVTARGEHPTPGRETAAITLDVLRAAETLGSNDDALVLISGGGSAMLESPRDGVSIEELAQTTNALMHAGASIAELNAVRRCLSRVKGGGLARALAPARTLVVVLSDVPGADVRWVASGPCSMPPREPDPREVVRRLGVPLPDSVRRAVDEASWPEAAAFDHVHVEIAGDVGTAVDGVIREGARRGLKLVRAPAFVAGEAREAGPRFAREAAAWADASGAHGVVTGGETTVTVRGAGVGGRNQEAALAVLADASAPLGAFVAIATDGVDGTSDAAGAFVDAEMRSRSERTSLLEALASSDSANAMRTLDAQLVTGPTGTNVADVWVWLQDAPRG